MANLMFTSASILASKGIGKSSRAKAAAAFRTATVRSCENLENGQNHQNIATGHENGWSRGLRTRSGGLLDGSVSPVGAA
jgi:hypothetical protein